MPEGPEIRLAADKLRRVLAGRRIASVRFAEDRFPHLQEAGRRFGGRTILRVEARGKAILTHFDNALTIYSHNQLYGQWRVFRGPAQPTHLQTRLALRTATHTAVLYSASDIEVLKSTAVDAHPYIARLGIELLDRATSEDDVEHQIGQARFARRNLGALLLDQGFLAGIGNYLRSEILFEAGLRHDACPAELSSPQRRALAVAALTLARRSYRTRGITNDPARAARLKAQGWSFGRYRHHVFDREGEACHACGGLIRRVDSGGRGMFLCEHCQPVTGPTPNQP